MKLNSSSIGVLAITPLDAVFYYLVDMATRSIRRFCIVGKALLWNILNVWSRVTGYFALYPLFLEFDILEFCHPGL